MADFTTEIPITVGDCDPTGALSHQSLVAVLERGRWLQLGEIGAVDSLLRQDLWLIARRFSMDVNGRAEPGDLIRLHQTIAANGRSGLVIRQVARRAIDEGGVATAECHLDCVDRNGRPREMPFSLSGLSVRAGSSASGTDHVTVNGVSLAYESRGSGPAIVFIHAFPLDRTCWRHQVETLTGYRRIAVDLRGMGESDAPDLGYSMATYADDVAGVLDALGEQRVIICGLSMGGYVAFEILRRHRDRVRGLILMDTRAEADTADGRKARDVLVGKVREQGPMAAAEAMLPRFFTAAVSPEIIETVRAMVLRTPVAGITGALTAMRDRIDSTSLLGTLGGVPSMVIVGEEDVITPPALARAMAAAIPDCRLVEIPGAGHLPCVEQPVPTSRAILKFLQSLR